MDLYSFLPKRAILMRESALPTIEVPTIDLAFFSSAAFQPASESEALFVKMAQSMGASAAPIIEGCLAWRSQSSLPKVLVVLGAAALQEFISESFDWTQVRGKFKTTERDGRVVQLLPTWHPDDLLANAKLKREAWSDLQLVQKELGWK